MELFIMTLLTISAAVVIVWALVRLIERVYNIVVLKHAPHDPDITKQKHGIVYNKKTKSLEADQSPITPF